MQFRDRVSVTVADGADGGQEYAFTLDSTETEFQQSAWSLADRLVALLNSDAAAREGIAGSARSTFCGNTFTD